MTVGLRVGTPWARTSIPELFSDLAGLDKPGAPVFAFVNYVDAHFPL